MESHSAHLPIEVLALKRYESLPNDSNLASFVQYFKKRCEETPLKRWDVYRLGNLAWMAINCPFPDEKIWFQERLLHVRDSLRETTQSTAQQIKT